MIVSDSDPCRINTDTDATCQVISDPEPEPDRQKVSDSGGYGSATLLFSVQVADKDPTLQTYSDPILELGQVDKHFKYGNFFNIQCNLKCITDSNVFITFISNIKVRSGSLMIYSATGNSKKFWI